jgi:hypothetical protein
MSKTELVEIGFLSGIGQATCKCHAGLWAITVWMVQPGKADTPVGQKHFATEKECDDNVEAFTKQIAEDHLNKMGVTIETETPVMHGDEALKTLKDFKKNNNPNLH